MEKKEVLYLPVTAEWFKLIKSGVKRVEYREIKAHWIKRLFFRNIDGDRYRLSDIWALFYSDKLVREILEADIKSGELEPIYEYVEFTRGYPTKDDKERRARFVIDSITIGKPQKGLCPDEFLGNEYLCINFK